jgi:C-terminal processing protease CtpA/Prc
MHRRTLWFFLVSFSVGSLAASEAKRSSKDDAVQMRPYQVTEKPFDGFSVSYGMRYLLWGPIDDVSFEDVDSGSFPAKRGIKSGDRLISINGSPVKGMKRKDFEQRFFRTGAVLVLELQTPGAKEVRKIELQFDPNSWEK